MTRTLLKVLISCAVGLFALLVVLPGCKKDLPTAAYVPGSASGAQPVISGITPATGALAGLSQLQLNGSNFSTNPAENFVYFDTARALVQTATPTALTFLAPIFIKKDIQVRVGVAGTELFSTPFIYTLNSATPILDTLNANDDPKSLTHDASGNLLVSVEPNTSGASVSIFPSGGGKATQYSPPFAGAAKSYSGMKMGPGGVLYVVNKQNRILTIASQGAVATPWVNVGSRTKNLADLDFDASKNIWTGGQNDSIFSVTPAKVVRGFAFGGNVRSVRVSQGYLYVGANVNGDEGVWRFQINSSDNLGAAEQYFDFGAAYASAGKVNAIAFAADGDLYIGSEGIPLVVVHPGKTSETVYPQLLTLQTAYLTWGPGNELFAARHDPGTADVKAHAIVRVNLMKPGAPYYGIQ